MKAWTVKKTGQYRASSKWWVLGCVGETKSQAWQNAKRLSGMTDREMKEGGLVPVEFEFNFIEPGKTSRSLRARNRKPRS